jgi:hypothetical protein
VLLTQQDVPPTVIVDAGYQGEKEKESKDHPKDHGNAEVANPPWTYFIS